MTNLNVAALIISFLSLICSFICLALWLALRLSTHKIEWRNIKMEDAQDTATLSKKLTDPYDEEDYDLL